MSHLISSFRQSLHVPFSITTQNLRFPVFRPINHCIFHCIALHSLFLSIFLLATGLMMAVGGGEGTAAGWSELPAVYFNTRFPPLLYWLPPLCFLCLSYCEILFYRRFPPPWVSRFLPSVYFPPPFLPGFRPPACPSTP